LGDKYPWPEDKTFVIDEEVRAALRDKKHCAIAVPIGPSKFMGTSPIARWFRTRKQYGSGEIRLLRRKSPEELAAALERQKDSHQ
jgi:hypothetical protein